MAFEALFQGLKQFDEGIKEYKISKAIGAASLQVADLKKQLESDTSKKINAQKESSAIAENLRLRLVELNADPNQIANSFQSIAGPSYRTPEEKILAEGGIPALQDYFKKREADKVAIETAGQIQVNAAKAKEERLTKAGEVKASAAKPTEKMQNAYEAAGVMKLSQEKYNELSTKIPDFSKKWGNIGIKGLTTGQLLGDANTQIYNTAKSQWVEGYIRYKSGANIPIEERSMIDKTYWAQIGDKPETIAYKDSLRSQVQALVERSASGKMATEDDFKSLVDNSKKAVFGDVAEIPGLTKLGSKKIEEQKNSNYIKLYK